jgi:hypothetical protein
MIKEKKINKKMNNMIRFYHYLTLKYQIKDKTKSCIN